MVINHFSQLCNLLKGTYVPYRIHTGFVKKKFWEGKSWAWGRGGGILLIFLREHFGLGGGGETSLGGGISSLPAPLYETLTMLLRKTNHVKSIRGCSLVESAKY